MSGEGRGVPLDSAYLHSTAGFIRVRWTPPQSSFRGVATLTDAWEPANQLEHQLRDALRDGDQDAYFALVSAAELFVPLAPEEAETVLANPSAFTWPTSTREGRTHVLAYTSAEAGRTCLGPTYQHFIPMTLADMARTWPDQEWWLALNSGLPIEGYLPAWFIGQLTAGIAPVPGEAPPQDAAQPASVPQAAHAHPPFPDGVPSLENGMRPGGVRRPSCRTRRSWTGYLRCRRTARCRTVRLPVACPRRSRRSCRPRRSATACLPCQIPGRGPFQDPRRSL